MRQSRSGYPAPERDLERVLRGHHEPHALPPRPASRRRGHSRALRAFNQQCRPQCEGAFCTATEAATACVTKGLTFSPISLNGEDKVVAPAGYTSEILIRWGDPLFLDPGTGFEFGAQSAAQQERQFGYNNDWMGFIPLAENRALLCVNHEYTNPELMFKGYSADAPTRDQVDYELAAHGFSVVHLERHWKRGWRYTMGAWHNRRITGT
ncbi:alkaline phosphatase PhoX [Candidatus Amarobacter glycogenicus]|uniref:PhoX family protein n=1 Tax=Candidatus Amarobacter glycogenicus TaxID=3140699 RepID=UPI002A13098F|nr:DUF839 domain-containing protein [Dehalococcoidia bacterium]